MLIHEKVFYGGVFFILGVFGAAFDISFLISVSLMTIAVFLLKADFRFRLILILLFILGSFYLNFYESLNKVRVDSRAEELTGTIISKPEYRLEYSLIEVELEDPNSGVVRVYLEPGKSFRYGDKVSIGGELTTTSRGNTIISFPKNIIKIEPAQRTVRGTLFYIRDSLVYNLEKVLPASKSSLAAGILIGERTGFTKEFEESMSGSGTTHIVALSGYNVAVIVVILSSIFGYLLNRRWAFYASLMAVPLFVIMTGAEPSVVRAAIMGLVLVSAEYLGRQYSFKNILVLTALAMLIYNPTLIISLSFQLSFAALLGIVYIYPWLSEKFNISQEGFLSWRKNALQTFSAQLAVTPVILLGVGKISLTSLFANTLILEFIPLTMLLSFMVATIGFISFPVSQVIGWGLNLLLSYEVFIINFFGSLWT